MFSRSRRSGSRVPGFQPYILATLHLSQFSFDELSYPFLILLLLLIIIIVTIIIDIIIGKANAVVHMRLFPFFIFCFQRTLKHSSTAAVMHIQIIVICMPQFQELEVSFLFFNFPSGRRRGHFGCSASSLCVCKIILICKVVHSVMFNLCIPVLHNFHLHMHIYFKFFAYMLICIYFIQMHIYIISILAITHGTTDCALFLPLKEH